MSKFAFHNNVYFEFFTPFCIINSQATNEILLWGIVGADGLYSFPNLEIQSCTDLVMTKTSQLYTTSAVMSKTSQLYTTSASANNSQRLLVLIPLNLVIWHTRLGHPNDNVWRLVLTL